ncbi:MAG: lytic transglycosylase domain-containing protein [Acetobacteraceae bacterium]
MHRARRRLELIRPPAALFALAVCAVTPARAQSASPCEAAGSDAERQYALPAGLLGAIGRVESGRWDATLGRVVPSPWAIDAAGQPHLTDSRDAALQRTRDLQANGVRNIDVGCFQINLLAHPAAFTDLAQAFDPVANAQYAARFLTSLRTRLGSWDDAVAAYHSATPSRGIPYRELVYANWNTPEGWRRALTNAPSLAAKSVEPLKVFSIGGTQIRVWTPSAVGSGAALVPMPGGSAPSLPRVITPRG